MSEITVFNNQKAVSLYNQTQELVNKYNPISDIHNKVKITDMISTIASKGVRFIPAPKYTPETLAGQLWDTGRFFESTKIRTIVPESGHIFQNIDEFTSLRFDDYKTTNKFEKSKSTKSNSTKSDFVENNEDLE